MKQKRIIVIILLTALFFAPASLVFAQNEHQGDAAGQSKNGAHPNEMMMGHGMMMDDGMMDMMNMMNVRRAMMDRQIVPTADGGVVLLIGDQLYKYDENLDLVNEVEISVDYERMKEGMQDMRLPNNDSPAEDHDDHH